MKKMNVLNGIIRNSSLNGMPIWFKATSLILFTAIATVLLISLVLVIIYGPEMNIRYGY